MLEVRLSIDSRLAVRRSCSTRRMAVRKTGRKCSRNRFAHRIREQDRISQCQESSHRASPSPMPPKWQTHVHRGQLRGSRQPLSARPRSPSSFLRRSQLTSTLFLPQTLTEPPVDLSKSMCIVFFSRPSTRRKRRRRRCDGSQRRFIFRTRVNVAGRRRLGVGRWRHRPIARRISSHRLNCSVFGRATWGRRLCRA